MEKLLWFNDIYEQFNVMLIKKAIKFEKNTGTLNIRSSSFVYEITVM